MSIAMKRRSCWFVCLVIGVFSSQAISACMLSTSGLNFDKYNPLARSAVESVGEIIVDCDEPVAYSLTLSTGNGSYQARKLVSDDQSLIYNLFINSSRTSVWGDGSAETAVISGSGEEQYEVHSVYGRIPGEQNVSPGQYQDTVIVRIEY